MMHRWIPTGLLEKIFYWVSSDGSAQGFLGAGQTSDGMHPVHLYGSNLLMPAFLAADFLDLSDSCVDLDAVAFAWTLCADFGFEGAGTEPKLCQK